MWAWFKENFVPDLWSMFSWLWLRILGVFPWVPYVKILIGLVALWEAVSWTLQELASASVQITAFFGQQVFQPDSTLLHYGAFMNRFLPLTETFALVLVIFNLWLAVTLFRWAKSIIPSISN